MTSFELRPLAIGELLDRSFTLFKRHLLLFVGIMAVPSVFGLAAALAFGIISVGNQGIVSVGNQPPFSESRPPDFDQIGPWMAVLFGGVLLFLIVNWIVYMLALGATTVAVSELYVGRPASIRAAYGHVARQFGPLMLLGLIAVVRIGGLFVVVIMTATVVSLMLTMVLPILAPLIIFIALVGTTLLCGFLALRYAVSVPALVLEQASAAASIRRSIFLTRGHLGSVILLVVCAMVLTYASLAVFQAPFMVASVMAGPETTMGISMNLLGTVAGSIGSTLTAPIMVIGFAVLYYDLRIRKEALDLEMMMRALDSGNAGGTSGSVSGGVSGSAPRDSPGEMHARSADAAPSDTTTPAFPVLPD